MTCRKKIISAYQCRKNSRKVSETISNNNKAGAIHAANQMCSTNVDRARSNINCARPETLFTSFYFCRVDFSSFSLIPTSACKPNSEMCSCAVFYNGVVVVNKSFPLSPTFALSQTFPFRLQMATRLSLARTSWLSRHLLTCRSSSQSFLSSHPVNSVNHSVSSRNMSKGASGKCLQMDTINPCIKTMEYAVR